MSPVDLGARAGKYSLFLPSIQVASARSICMAEWTSPLPRGLRPADFNYLDPGNRFWTYPYALASAETFQGQTGNAVTGADPSCFILGDSGGFQIGSGTGRTKKWKGYDECEVSAAFRESDIVRDNTEWCELHCQFAMTLDLPLWARNKKFKATPFHQCSAETLRTLSVETLEHLERIPDRRCRYLNVLQGETPNEEDEWYRAVKRFAFDGWAFAGQVGVGGGPYRILRRLLILRDQKRLDKGNDRLHFLGLSQPIWAPVMTAIQRGVRKHVKNRAFAVTYDASTPYKMGGRFEEYYEARGFTADRETWRNHGHKFPTTYGFAASKNTMPLATASCRGNKCSMCSQGKPHLPAPLTSPILKNLCVADLITNEADFAGRRGGTLFQEAIINHNVYVLVDAMIRANEAVFEQKNSAPSELIDAVGLIDDLLKVEKWKTMLDKNRADFEAAV